MIKKHSIDQVIDTVRIEEVVEDFVRLKRRGSGYQGLCPFHNEKTPSFTVNPSGNFYKCFGCGMGGNAVNFIMEHEKLSFPEAIRYLAQKYNIELEEEQASQEEKVEIAKRENMLAIMQYGLQYFQDQLTQTEEGRAIGMSYFKERGFLESTIKAFGLGYAAKDRIALTQKALKDGYTLDLLKDCGLTAKSGNDFFFDRVMFTIHDLSGRPVAFAGRILNSHIKAPKYINSPETEIYKKSHILYGLYQARKAMRVEDNCIVVEGYTDVLSLYQSGIENVVASSGTALTEGQLRQIKRFTSRITMLYDGDKAGVNAAIRAIDLIHEQDMSADLVVLPEKNDPDSFIRQMGADGFKTFIKDHALDFISFRKYVLEQDGKPDPLQKAEIIKEVIQSIAKIPDAIKRNLYVQSCASIFEIDESTLVDELNSTIRKELYRQRKKQDQDIGDESEWISTEKKSKQSTAATLPPEYHQERDILRILIKYGDAIALEEDDTSLAAFILLNIENAIDSISHEDHKLVFQEALKALDQDININERFFVHHENERLQRICTDIIASPHEYSENWANRWGLELQTQLHPDKNFMKDASQAILRFKLKKIRAQQLEFIKQIAEAEANGETDVALEIAKLYVKLKEDDMAISKDLNGVIIP